MGHRAAQRARGLPARLWRGAGGYRRRRADDRPGGRLLASPELLRRHHLPERQMSKLRFSSIARRIATLAGRPGTFVFAVTLILLWGLSGPVFGFSDTWQLIINT